MIEWKLSAMFVTNRKIVCSFDYENHSNKSHALFQEIYDIYIDNFY